MLQILLDGLLLSIAWFVLGGALYMNPVIAKIYKKLHGHKGMKHWKNQGQYLGIMYALGCLIPAITMSAIFYYLSPIDPLGFAIVLIGIRIIPRFVDMWIQSSYPEESLAIEIINGSLLSIMAAYLLNYLA